MEGSNSSGSNSRSKHGRGSNSGSAAGTVRSRSPPVTHAGDQGSSESGRPPAKRARKAINCEPCRNSKLKCDRNRPCSSCVLRGSTAQCYTGVDANISHGLRGDELSRNPNFDPHHEIARIRQSLSMLEGFISQNNGRGSLSAPTPAPATPSYPTASPLDDPTVSLASAEFPKREPVEPEIKRSLPGVLGQQSQGGLYAGPTSTVTHLTGNEPRDDDSRQSGSEDETQPLTSIVTHDYDRDLLDVLPPVNTMDLLIDFYFEYCNWIYRHVNQPAFTHAWARYKTGASPDHLVLATASVIMAIAVFYLPERHEIFDSMPDSHQELGTKFYGVTKQALARHQSKCRTYTLELVELLLIRCHYLTLSKTDAEEIWTVRGELITIATAMGLHRDPKKWKMSREVAERRRWAWWHIILLERWQAFLFGRPISIASQHFDTSLPSAYDPSLLSNTQHPSLYHPNIALFKLAYALGDIMDAAVSLRGVPYETIMSLDRSLQAWIDDLPKELDLDDFNVARYLASRDVPTRRIGVQSVIIRTSYHHIRFSLHRPYASSTADSSSDSGKPLTSKSRSLTLSPQQQSLEIAVQHARQLIHLVSQARPDFLANSSLAVPGHMNWGPFHIFSAAMFFSFQVISNPDQPGANMFRGNIRAAMQSLEQCQGAPVADKALNILRALSAVSLADDTERAKMDRESKAEREKRKTRVLSSVKRLAFPYHDSPTHPHPPTSSPMNSPAVGSDGSNTARQGSQAGSPSVSDGSMFLGELNRTISHNSPQPTVMGSLRSPSELSTLAPYTHPPPPPPPHMHPPLNQPSPSHLPPHSYSQQRHQSRQTFSLPGTSSLTLPDPQYTSQQAQQQVYAPALSAPQPMYDMSYPQAPTEEMVWGASMGFGQGEWSNFIHAMQQDVNGPRPPSGSGAMGHP
ncbi:hypothetical protein JAAARDRAFT_64792 [Jaapia argillacea MUCL 33604]|uniref:Zn(2)-C6 fungal-type domain-containing protein n=1 Tax=Jaapia argillacea MUCL 33604 TaxID=933084 RepID=A0A067QFQ9_9AGAM|nr:hypothetical protein JAAARDRAFT_64792 [Jaapia argillacea MUCL 33604]